MELRLLAVLAATALGTKLRLKDPEPNALFDQLAAEVGLGEVKQKEPEPPEPIERPDVVPDKNAPKYKVGEFMEFEVLEGPYAGSWVPCSITSYGDLPDTYNLYAWSVEPSKRNMYNVPVELLRTKAEQDAKRKAIADAIRKVWEEEEAKRRAIEEAERRARDMEEARRMAEEEAERQAREEAEAKRLADEEARHQAEEQEARRKAEEDARLRAEAELREKVDSEARAALRRVYLKAKWDQVKAAKAEAEVLARLKAEEAAVARAQERSARISKGERALAPPKPMRDPENIRVTLRYQNNKEVTMKVKRNLRLRSLMTVACERMGLDPTRVRFVLGNKIFSPEDTAERFGRQDSVVIHVEQAHVEAKPSAARLLSLAGSATASSYEVGDFAQVKGKNDQGREVLVPCTIKAKGGLPETLSIHFMFSAGGQQDILDVPASMLQKVKGKEYAIAVKSFKDNPDTSSKIVRKLATSMEAINRDRQAMQSQPQEASKPVEDSQPMEENKPVEEATQKEEEADQGVRADALEVGDFAELSLKDGTTIPCSIAGKGEEPQTLDVHFIFALGDLHGLRDIRRVPTERLRKIRAARYVQAVRELKKDREVAQRWLEEAAQQLSSH